MVSYGPNWSWTLVSHASTSQVLGSQTCRITGHIQTQTNFKMGAKWNLSISCVASFALLERELNGTWEMAQKVKCLPRKPENLRNHIKTGNSRACL